jgi:N-acetylneuraminic acid mutarotase
VDNFGQANALLIHESVHHFGIDDEAFADKISIAIVQAWKQGKTEWLTVPATLIGSPSPRSQHSAVWTGSKMIIYGGATDDAHTINSNRGYQFDPVTFAWTELSSVNAPARYGHTAVWTGDSMIIWGGFKISSGRSNWQNSGAVWSAASNSWKTIINPFGPAETGEFSSVQLVQTAVWARDRLIVWGGMDARGEPIGGIYTPSKGTWKRISSVGAPHRTNGHTATWIDGKMIVWGGVMPNSGRTNTGAIYDPEGDTWEALPTEGAPVLPTERHSAAWTGSELIVFSGFTSAIDLLGHGATYNPDTKKWKIFVSESVMARTEHSSVWTGASLLFFGGKAARSSSRLNAVASFNPQSYESISRLGVNAPTAREKQTAVWTGSSMIVWGGSDEAGHVLGNGGIYYP